MWTRRIFLIAACIIYSVDTFALHERKRWLVLGEEIGDGSDQAMRSEVERYKLEIPTLETIEVPYKTEDGKIINYVAAAASRMQGFVSVVEGGLGTDAITIKYTSENNTSDELFIYIESNRPSSLILLDDAAIVGSTMVVTDELKNWTRRLLQPDV